MAMTRFTFTLDDKVYKRIRDEAKHEGRTIANMMRRLIDEALAARPEEPVEDERAGR